METWTQLGARTVGECSHHDCAAAVDTEVCTAVAVVVVGVACHLVSVSAVVGPL